MSMHSACAGKAARLAGLAFALSLSMPAGAQRTIESDPQPPITGLIQIGPFAFGKTTEEILAAHPELPWDIKRFEKKSDVLRAKGGLQLAGQRFDLMIIPEENREYDAQYTDYVIAFASHTMDGMNACQGDVVKVVGALEGVLGFFSPISVSLVDPSPKSIKAGRKSRVEVNRDSVNALWYAERVTPLFPDGDGYSATLQAHYNGRGQAKGCFIEVRAIYESQFARR